MDRKEAEKRPIEERMTAAARHAKGLEDRIERLEARNQELAKSLQDWSKVYEEMARRNDQTLERMGKRLNVLEHDLRALR